MRGRCFLAVLFLFLVFSIEAFGQVVEIPDPNLRGAIEETLNKRAGARITVDDMADLWFLYGWGRDIRNLKGLEHAINLTDLVLDFNLVSDLSPLAELSRLTSLVLDDNPISDLSPLTGLTRLDRLSLRGCDVSDLSPLSGLLRLRYLTLDYGAVSDVSPLEGLLRLEYLSFNGNLIQDVSPLSGLINLEEIEMDDNFVSDVSPLLSNSGLGDGDTVDLWGNPLSSDSIKKHIPALRNRGVYVNRALFVSVISPDVPLRVSDEFTWHFRIENVVEMAGWQASLYYNPERVELLSITYGDFLARSNKETVPAAGSVVNASDLQIEEESYRNQVPDLFQVRLGGGWHGNGPLLLCKFRAIGTGDTGIRMRGDFRTPDGERRRVGSSWGRYRVEDPSTVDVNGDGKIDIDDLLLIAEHIGEYGEDLLFDVDDNWRVDIRDMIFVIQRFSTTPASPATVSDMTLPAGLTSAMVRGWIDMAHTADDGSVAFRKGIATLNDLLEAIGPDETALFPNYPNPFNPETWIPYSLAAAADVTLTIYDTTGAVVRRFDVGHRVAGYYTDRARAVHWDGRNGFGEPVGNGVYFYHLSAGEFSATRKMVILK